MLHRPAIIVCAATFGLAVASASASAQNFDRQTTTSIPSGTTADIVDSPPSLLSPLGGLVGGALGLATAPLAPFEGRSAFVARYDGNAKDPSLDYARSAYPPSQNPNFADDVFISARASGYRGYNNAGGFGSVLSSGIR